MDPERVQQRRVMFALALSALLVPAYFLIGRAESNANTAQTQSTVVEGAAVTVELGELDVMGTIPQGYLTGGSEDSAGALPTIVIPAPLEVLTTKAIFLSDVTGRGACLVPGAPRDETVTVVNTDNGRGVECKNSVDPADYAERANPEYAILQTEAFLRIAELTDAPVPVEVSW